MDRMTQLVFAQLLLMSTSAVRLAVDGQKR